MKGHKCTYQHSRKKVSFVPTATLATTNATWQGISYEAVARRHPPTSRTCRGADGTLTDAVLCLTLGLLCSFDEILLSVCMEHRGACGCHLAWKRSCWHVPDSAGASAQRVRMSTCTPLNQFFKFTAAGFYPRSIRDTGRSWSRGLVAGNCKQSGITWETQRRHRTSHLIMSIYRCCEIKKRVS